MREIFIKVYVDEEEEYEKRVLMMADWMDKSIPWPYEIFRDKGEIEQQNYFKFNFPFRSSIIHNRDKSRIEVHWEGKAIRVTGKFETLHLMPGGLNHYEDFPAHQRGLIYAPYLKDEIVSKTHVCLLDPTESCSPMEVF